MNNLKQLRKEKGVTQTEVAKYIGISQNNYSYWENGKVKIDNNSLQKLAEYFKVTVDYILGRETTKKQETNDEYTEDEKQLIEDFRSLTPELKKMITETMKTFTRSEINISAKKKSNNKRT